MERFLKPVFLGGGINETYFERSRHCLALVI